LSKERTISSSPKKAHTCTSAICIEFHLFDTGHFALEEDGDKIADLITCFMAKNTDLLARHSETCDKCAFAA
jgi:hypothetical protein